MTTCIPLILFVVAVLLRLPFQSRLLYHHDSVNFALALQQYDLRLHQPHPPGYFLYVMLGRLCHLLIPDANSALISISILFTSLTVPLVYLLGKEMYDFRTGVIASLLALACPNLWFYGEVALSYGVEAFFSTLVGYLCWKLYQGRHGLLPVSALALALAGGFRQNTLVFLLPLWLISIRRIPLRQVATSVLLLGVACAAWFMGMVWMTGGIEAYAMSLGNLWQSDMVQRPSYHDDWPNVLYFGQMLLTFALYTVGAGAVVLGLALYGAVRKRELSSICRGKRWFYAAWIIPGYLFYQFVFIQIANPGYVLIFVSPLMLLCARAIVKTDETVQQNWAASLLTAAVLAVNVSFFLCSDYVISRQALDKHSRFLAAIVSELQYYDPNTTAIVLKPKVFCGFRLVMYYLPQYHVYNLGPGNDGVGEQVIWGTGRRTYLSKEMALPANLQQVVTLQFADTGVGERRAVTGLEKGWLASGPASEMIQAIGTGGSN